MLTHNIYFDGNVQTVGFERHGRRQTVGVIDAGEFHFSTGGPERMTVVAGELTVRIDGSQAWHTYPAGTSFEVPGTSGFDVKVSHPAGYFCEFL